MKRQKDVTLNDEPSRSVGVQYATGKEQRSTFRRNEEAEPKQKHCPVVDMSSGGNKVRCYKEQYCTGTWNSSQTGDGKNEHQHSRIQ